jgi:monoamine oxidase
MQLEQSEPNCLASTTAWSRRKRPVPSSSVLHLSPHLVFLFLSFVRSPLGLTAAHTIETRSPTTTYVLLEAKDKVGGKMQAAFASETALGITVEDGANWIGGFSPNPMFDLAVEFGLRVYPHDYTSFASYTAATGARLSPGSVNGAIAKIPLDCVEKAGIKINDDFRAGRVTTDISIKEQLRRCGWTPRTPIDHFVDWFEIDYDRFGGPATVATTSYYDGTQEDFLDPNNKYQEYFVVDERGFEYLPIMYAARLINPPILNTEVCKVDYSNVPATVQARTCSVTTCTCTNYKAKKVISTISPNIYRKNPTLFSPALNMARNPFHEGDYQKVYYRFPTAFWDTSLQFINAVHAVDKRGQCGWFHNLDYYRDDTWWAPNVDDEMWPGSRVLFCLIVTDAVESLGGTITSAIAQTFLEPLKKIYPSTYVDPVATYIPNWNDDPYSFGPIYWKAGFGMADFQNYVMQGRPTIHISGSHTCRRYGGWTHGAYHAGIRSANIVLAELGVVATPAPESICDVPIVF